MSENMNKPKTVLNALVDGHKNTEEIIELSNRQAIIANKQFKLSLLLTVTSLIIGFASLYPIVFGSDNTIPEKLNLILEKEKQQSETIKELSIELDSILNKVKPLEKQIENISKNND